MADKAADRMNNLGRGVWTSIPQCTLPDHTVLCTCHSFSDKSWPPSRLESSKWLPFQPHLTWLQHHPGSILLRRHASEHLPSCSMFPKCELFANLSLCLSIYVFIYFVCADRHWWLQMFLAFRSPLWKKKSFLSGPPTSCLLQPDTSWLRQMTFTLMARQANQAHPLPLHFSCRKEETGATLG